jgi:hypothetical protein
MSEPEPLITRRPHSALPPIGAAAIVIGLLLDVAEHSFAAAPDVTVATLGQHAAHLVVLIGMLLVLVGIVRDGMSETRRPGRQEAGARHALR